MKYLVLTISLLVCSIYVYSQNTTENKHSHQLGLSAGFTTGVGFSYRHWNNNLGFQITTIPIKIEEEWTDLSGIRNFYSNFPIFLFNNKTFISLGLTGLYSLKEFSSYKVLSYLGNHFLIREEFVIYNVGAGLGISFEKKIGFTLMVGYQGYDLTESFSLLPTIEVSLLYKLSK